MSRVLFTSDLHFRDNKVSALRGYVNAAEHDDAMLALWETQVRPHDIVYVLGDLTSGRTREGERWALEALRGMPSIKHLVLGNHDSAHPMSSGSRNPDWIREWFATFNSVSPIGVRKTNGYRLMLSHFPYDGPGGDHTETNRHIEWRPADIGRWLLHGHTHLEQQHVHGRQIHVGFDAWGRLVSEEELVALIKVAEAGRDR